MVGIWYVVAMIPAGYWKKKAEGLNLASNFSLNMFLRAVGKEIFCSALETSSCIVSIKTDTFLPVSGAWSHVLLSTWNPHIHKTLLSLVILHKKCHFLFTVTLDTLSNTRISYFCVSFETSTEWMFSSFFFFSCNASLVMWHFLWRRKNGIAVGIHTMKYGELMWQKSHNSNHVLVSNRSFFTRFNVWRWEKSFIYTFQMCAIRCCNDDKIGAIIWNGFLWEICEKYTYTLNVLKNKNSSSFYTQIDEHRNIWYFSFGCLGKSTSYLFSCSLCFYVNCGWLLIGSIIFI